MSKNHENIKIMHVINGEFFSGAERVQDVLAMRLPDLFLWGKIISTFQRLAEPT